MSRVKIDKADHLFAQWIKYRDKWTCQRCGRAYKPPTRALHASHFKGRGKEATRFDPKNVDAICMGCHLYFSAQPDEHYGWQVAKKGQAVVDDIILRSSQYKKKDRKAERDYWRNKLIKEFAIEL